MAQRFLGIAGSLILLLFCAKVTIAADVWYLNTPLEYQRHLGGAPALGTYSSEAACESVRIQSFGVNGSCRPANLPQEGSTVRFQLSPDDQMNVNDAFLEYMKIKQLSAR